MYFNGITNHLSTRAKAPVYTCTPKCTARYNRVGTPDKTIRKQKAIKSHSLLSK